MKLAPPLTLLLAASFSALSQPAHGESLIAALLSDPAAANKFDYCVWAKSLDSNEKLPNFEATLDQEDELSALQRAATTLAKAGTSIALGAKDHRACGKAFTNGRKVHAKELAKWRHKIGKGEKPSLSKVPAIASVQEKISDFWVSDQAARQTYIKHRDLAEQGAPYWTRALTIANIIQIDAASTAYMQELLAQYDWIDSHRFGLAIAKHAWLVVQHADRHPEFQQLALERMEAYLDNQGVRQRDYAYLWDRVAVNHDRKQRYGTQPDWQCKDGKMQLQPLEDPETVDQRRAEMGLGPVQEELDQMSRSNCRS